MEYIKPEDRALFKKGIEIYEVCKSIISLIPEENTTLKQVSEFIISDALNLSVKVAGASKTKSYDLQIEAAVIIRKSARDLMVQNHSLEMFGLKEFDYFKIVRGLIEEYRLLFVEWVKGFEKPEPIEDNWGLINKL
ncbi:MAG: hypothetical protein RH860_05210 [Cytophagales bacterium]